MKNTDSSTLKSFKTGHISLYAALGGGVQSKAFKTGHISLDAALAGGVPSKAFKGSLRMPGRRHLLTCTPYIMIDTIEATDEL